MSGKRIFITDKEVAAVAECSVASISRFANGFVRGGKGRKTAAASNANLKDAKPLSVNGMRRWKASMVAKVLGITEDELWRRIS